MKTMLTTQMNQKKRAIQASLFSLLALLTIAWPARADFMIVALPDTQYYTDPDPTHGGLPAMFTAQTDWIKNNRVASNIVYVAHLGDMTDTGDSAGNVSSLQQWQNCTNALYRLESPVSIPYGPCVGNHDQSPNGSPTGTTTKFNTYFGFSHFNGRSYYGGRYGTSNNDNHYDLFTADGRNFIVIYLEYDANNDVPGALTWADNLLTTYNSRMAIIVSHYIGSPDIPSTFGAQGQRIYDMAKDHTNVFLTLSGHVAGKGARQDVYNGHTITSLTSDYQFNPEGGGGYMRLYRISLTNNTITSSVYSPYHNLYFPAGADSVTTSFEATENQSAETILKGNGAFVTLGVNSITNNIVIRAQSSEGSPWGNWQDLGGTNVAQVQALLYRDQRFVAFYIGTNTPVNVRAQLTPGGNWSAWSALSGGPAGGFSYIRAVRFVDGRLAVAGVSSTGEIWVNVQSAYNSSWNGWSNLGAPAGVTFTQLDFVISAAKLAVFGVGNGTTVRFNTQTSPGGLWAGWTDLGGDPVTYVRARTYWDSRMLVFTVNSTNIALSAQNYVGAWSSWGNLGVGSSGGFNRVDPVIMPDWRIYLTAVATSDGSVWSIGQTAYNSSWDPWFNHTGAGFTSADGLMWTDGRLAIFGHGDGGPQYIKFQATEGGTFSSWSNLGDTLKSSW